MFRNDPAVSSAAPRGSGTDHSMNQAGSWIKDQQQNKKTTVVNNNDQSSTVSFESLFDSFVQANTSKSIVKSFDNVCKHLKINNKQVFESGYVLNQNGASPYQRVYSGKYSSGLVVANSLTVASNTPSNVLNTRLIYKIIKSKTNYWKANELWKKYDKKANSKDYFINRQLASYKDMNILIVGCGPVGLRLSIECALLGLKCTIVEKRDRFSRNNVLHLWPYTIIDLKNLGAKLFYGKFCAGSIDHISIRKLQCILLKVALLLGVQVHFNTQFEEIVEPSGQGSGGGWPVRILPENHSLNKEQFDAVIGADGRRNSLPGFKHKEFRGKLAIGITANFTNYHTVEEAEVEERSGVAFIFDQRFFLDLRDETGIDLENIVYYKDDTHYFVMTAKRQSLIDKGVIKQDFADAVQLLSKENVNFDKLCDYAKEAAYTSTNRKLARLDFAKNHYGQPDVAMFDFTSLFQSENASRIVERKGKRVLLALVGDSLLEPFWPTGTGVARGFLAAMDTAWMIKNFAAGNRTPLELLVERESIYQLLSQTTHDNINKNYQEYTIDPFTRYINLNTKILQESQIRHLYDNGTSPLSPTRKTANKSNMQSQTLLHWAQMVVQSYNIKIENFTSSWTNALPFLAIIHRFNPDLIDYTKARDNPASQNVKQLFDIMRNKLGLMVEASPSEFIDHVPDKFTVLMMLDKLYALFKNHELKDVDFLESSFESGALAAGSMKRKIQKTSQDDTSLFKQQRPPSEQLKFNPAKRNSLRDGLTTVLKNKIEFFNNNDLMSHSAKSTNQRVQPTPPPQSQPSLQRTEYKSSICQAGSTCYICGKKVYLMERLNVMDFFMHMSCFKCKHCQVLLKNGVYNQHKDYITNKYEFYCTDHGPSYINSASGYAGGKRPLLEKGEVPEYSDETLKRFESKYEFYRNRYDTRPDTVDSNLSYHNYNRIGDARRIDEFKENFLLDLNLNQNRQVSERAEYESLNEKNIVLEDEDDDNENIYDNDDDDDDEDYDDEDEDSDERSENGGEFDIDDEEEASSDDEESQKVKDLNAESDTVNKQAPPLPSSDPPTSRSSVDRSTEPSYGGNVIFRSSVKRKDPYYELSLSQPRPLTHLFTKADTATSKSDETLDSISYKTSLSFTPYANMNTRNANSTGNDELVGGGERMLRIAETKIASTPVTCTISSLTVCSSCKKIMDVQNRVKYENKFYHTWCLKCFICDQELQPAHVIARPFNNNIFFYCEAHASRETTRRATPALSDCQFDLRSNKSSPMIESNDSSRIQSTTSSLFNQHMSSPSPSRTQRKSLVFMSESSNLPKQPPRQMLYSTPDSSAALNHNSHRRYKSTQSINETPSDESDRAARMKESFLNDILENQQKVILDIYLMRQRAQEKAKLKSDAELGLTDSAKMPPPPPTPSSSTVKPKFIPIYHPKNYRPRKKFNELGDDRLSDTDIKPEYTATAAPLAQSETLENLVNEAENNPYDNLTNRSNNWSSEDKYLDDKYLNVSKASSGKGKKLLIPNIRLNLNHSSDSDDDESTNHSNASSLLDLIDDEKQLEKSFSSMLKIDSTPVSYSSKQQQQQEEKKLEKQRKEKRLRMSQEIQRNLDEIENRLEELERDGVQLEKAISELDQLENGGQVTNVVRQLERRERLEQELYNLIHQKNLLTRAENDLNIKRRALAVEDQLAECQHQLRESLNIPDTKKTIEIINKEKAIMVRIVELVEQKNHLVEQLESLRQIAQVEDSTVKKTFSDKNIPLDQGDKLMDKYKYYSDII